MSALGYNVNILTILVTELCPVKGVPELTDGIEPTCFLAQNNGQNMVTLVSVNVSYNCLDTDKRLKLNISLGFGYTCLQLKHNLYTTRRQNQLSMCYNIATLAPCQIIEPNKPGPICTVLCTCSDPTDRCDIHLLNTSNMVEISQLSLCDVQIFHDTF